MPDDHMDMLMAEIRGLRAEFHDMRRELKSEAVRLASQVSVLEAWRNRQLGVLSFVGAVAGVVGAALVKFIGAMVAKHT